MKQKTSAVNQITEGVIWKQLLLFFFPIMLGTLFQQLYNTADAIIVGRFVGKEALACVGGSSGQLINLVVGFFVGLSSGATVIIARYYGAKNKKELNLHFIQLQPCHYRKHHNYRIWNFTCSRYAPVYEYSVKCNDRFCHLSAYLFCRNFLCLCLQYWFGHSACHG